MRTESEDPELVYYFARNSLIVGVFGASKPNRLPGRTTKDSSYLSNLVCYSAFRDRRYKTPAVWVTRLLLTTSGYLCRPGSAEFIQIHSAVNSFFRDSFGRVSEPAAVSQLHPAQPAVRPHRPSYPWLPSKKTGLGREAQYATVFPRCKPKLTRRHELATLGGAR
jgi:hypothetical protein